VRLLRWVETMRSMGHDIPEHRGVHGAHRVRMITGRP